MNFPSARRLRGSNRGRNLEKERSLRSRRTRWIYSNEVRLRQNRGGSGESSNVLKKQKNVTV